MSDKETLIKRYEELGSSNIDDLYYYSCLLASGFDKDTAYENIILLDDLFLTDENKFCISELSDMLHNVYDEIDTEEMTTREILQLMYNNEYEEEDEED